MVALAGSKDVWTHQQTSIQENGLSGWLERKEDEEQEVCLLSCFRPKQQPGWNSHVMSGATKFEFLQLDSPI
jgi:hypothetical protein